MLVLLYHGMASTQDVSLDRAHRVTSYSLGPSIEQVRTSEELHLVIIEFLKCMVQVAQVI